MTDTLAQDIVEGRIASPREPDTYDYWRGRVVYQPFGRVPALGTCECGFEWRHIEGLCGGCPMEDPHAPDAHTFGG